MAGPTQQARLLILFLGLLLGLLGLLWVVERHSPVLIDLALMVVVVPPVQKLLQGPAALALIGVWVHEPNLLTIHTSHDNIVASFPATRLAATRTVQLDSCDHWLTTADALLQRVQVHLTCIDTQPMVGSSLLKIDDGRAALVGGLCIALVGFLVCVTDAHRVL